MYNILYILYIIYTDRGKAPGAKHSLNKAAAATHRWVRLRMVAQSRGRLPERRLSSRCSSTRLASAPHEGGRLPSSRLFCRYRYLSRSICHHVLGSPPVSSLPSSALWGESAHSSSDSVRGGFRVLGLNNRNPNKHKSKA